MFFFKTLLNGLKTKLGCIKENFMLEHLQNFTFPSDIDKKLYKKYNLTDDEISYIEGTVKSMDTEPSKPTNTEPSKQKYTPQDVMANYINRQLQQQSK